MTRPQPGVFFLEPMTHRPGNGVSAHRLAEVVRADAVPRTLEASTGHREYNEQTKVSGEL